MLLLGDRQAWAGRGAGYIASASVGGTPVLSVLKLAAAQRLWVWAGRKANRQLPTAFWGQESSSTDPSIISVAAAAAVCPYLQAVSE